MQHQALFSIGLMCKVLHVSRSGYYAFSHHQPSQAKQKDEDLKSKMKIIFKENREVYGYRRLKKA